MNNIYKKFYEPVLRTKVYFFGGDKNRIYKRFSVDIPDKDDKTADGSTYLFEDSKGVQSIIVWLENPKDYYALEHEVVHLVKDALGMVEVPYTAKNTEIIAYYHEYWMKELWHFVSTKRSKKRISTH